MLIMVCILRYCFKNNIFGAGFINERIKNFDWGKGNEADRPSANIEEATINNIKTKKLKQTAAQAHLLLRGMAFLITDKVEEFFEEADETQKQECAAWMELLSLHVEIIRLLCCRAITLGQVDDLERKIVEHNILFDAIRNFASSPPPCINKVHHLLHYPRMIREWGPAPLYDTSRFEAFHHPLKMRMVSSNNFRNVSKTITDRIAMSFSYEHSYDHEKVLCDPMGSAKLIDPVHGLTFAHGQNMTYNNIHYQKGQILCLNVTGDDEDAEILPSFGRIVSMTYESNKLVFTVDLMETEYFDNEYGAYKVKVLDNEANFGWDNIYSKYPMALWQTCTEYPEDADDYVSSKSAEF